MIKIFFDTNLIQGQMFSTNGSFKEYSLSDFTLNRKIDKVVELINEMGIKNFTSLIIPEIVIDEIRQHKIETFRVHQKEFKNTCEKYKQIFGNGIKINFSQLQSEPEYVQILDNSIKKYIKDNSLNFKIAKLNIDLNHIKNKVINKELMFTSAKGENEKIFTDAGFKDNLILETLIQESNFNSDMVVLFSRDSDFDKASGQYKFKRIDDIESLKSYILENNKEAKIIHLLKSLNSADNKMNIAGYCKDHNASSIIDDSIVVDKLLDNDILIDEELNECVTSAKVKKGNKNYIIKISFNLDDYSVIDAQEVKQC